MNPCSLPTGVRHCARESRRFWCGIPRRFLLPHICSLHGVFELTPDVARRYGVPDNARIGANERWPEEPVAGADAVIGDRAYGTEPGKVAAIAGAVTEGLGQGGILPVLKHIPGHGRANADSHLRLPTVDTPLKELERTDFAAFRPLADLPMAMTSATIINQVIRGVIGFQGLLMSDDVSMNALSGSIAERTRAAFLAGCDMVLHCNGALAEMREVAAETPELSGKALQRASRALASRGAPQPFDKALARAELEAMMKRAETAGA